MWLPVKGGENRRGGSLSREAKIREVVSPQSEGNLKEVAVRQIKRNA
jgi:hypothetical protein